MTPDLTPESVLEADDLRRRIQRAIQQGLRCVTYDSEPWPTAAVRAVFEREGYRFTPEGSGLRVSW